MESYGIITWQRAEYVGIKIMLKEFLKTGEKCLDNINLRKIKQEGQKHSEATLAKTIVRKEGKMVKEERSSGDWKLSVDSRSTAHPTGPGGQEALKSTLAVRLKW